MDINGAKALKKRLGLNGADTAPPAAEPADIPADAPPVYHWTGKAPPEAAPEADDDSDASQCFALQSPGLELPLALRIREDGRARLECARLSVERSSAADRVAATRGEAGADTRRARFRSKVLGNPLRCSRAEPNAIRSLS